MASLALIGSYLFVAAFIAGIFLLCFIGCRCAVPLRAFFAMPCFERLAWAPPPPPPQAVVAQSGEPTASSYMPLLRV
tara:strand:- start:186 stop:416 length:231 start_codon:yes stop_codon:yes gene_type:complete